MGIRFGPFEYDAPQAELRRDGRVVRLQDLPLRILDLLLERPGELVTRQELRDRLWPAGAVQDFDNSLNAAVSKLRDALGDRAADARYVETVPRRGYRFVGRLEEPSPPASPRARRPWAVLVGVLVVTGVMAILVPPSIDREVPVSPARASILEGRMLLERRTRVAVVRAESSFVRATELDPESADAWAGLARTLTRAGIEDFARPHDVFPRARRAARRARGADPTHFAANFALAEIAFAYDWDAEAAAEELDRALRHATTSADSARVATARALLHSSRARHTEAVAAIRRARAIAPVSMTVRAAHGWVLFMAERHDEAVEVLREALVLDPYHLPAQDLLKWVHRVRGDVPEYHAAFFEVIQLEGDSEAFVAALRSRFPLERVDALEERVARSMAEDWNEDEGYRSAYDVAIEFAARAPAARAVPWLLRAIDAREIDAVYLDVDPRLKAVRADEDAWQVIQKRRSRDR